MYASAMHAIRADDGAEFEVWTGEMSTSTIIGKVTAVMSDVHGAEFPYTLKDDGWEIELSKGAITKRCWLVRGPHRVELIKIGSFYRMPTRRHARTEAVMAITSKQSALLRLNLRFAHVMVDTLKRLVSSGDMARQNMKDIDWDAKLNCHGCLLGKTRLMSYRHTNPSRASGICEKLMVDVCYVGEVNAPSWSYRTNAHASNGDCADLIIERIKILKTEGSNVKSRNGIRKQSVAHILAGTGTEYSTDLDKCIHTGGSSLVEKANHVHVLLSKVRATLVTADLPDSLWAEALLGLWTWTTCHQQRYMMENHRSKGCMGACLIWISWRSKAKRQSKLSNTPRLSLLLGLATHITGYRLLDPQTGKMLEHRDVMFCPQATVARLYVGILLRKIYGNDDSIGLPKKVPLVSMPADGTPQPSADDDSKQPPRKKLRFQNMIEVPTFVVNDPLTTQEAADTNVHTSNNTQHDNDADILINTTSYTDSNDCVRQPTLYSDNKGAIQVVANEGNHHKIKCLDLKMYKVKDYVAQGLLHFAYCLTAEMPADMLTKNLAKQSTFKLSESWMPKPS
ncbi:TPA: LOW QUALITY PROTEIN: hypothetical protein N0F65_008365 [Lagenidium giganteum]|uniref:Retroviral polymerase SH3-like domain-containing protein n=1 Tax=Lagenidium giganteum TaxID=4803 RepID=A0AAV2YRT6_9STRA|nr:TPA: LOW QUALITY PROTEIN: hypothetical protein N0F65_008365 [Lagenidium giganteum]